MNQGVTESNEVKQKSPPSASVTAAATPSILKKMQELKGAKEAERVFNGDAPSTPAVSEKVAEETPKADPQKADPTILLKVFKNVVQPESEKKIVKADVKPAPSDLKLLGGTAGADAEKQPSTPLAVEIIEFETTARKALAKIMGNPLVPVTEIQDKASKTVVKTREALKRLNELKLFGVDITLEEISAAAPSAKPLTKSLPSKRASVIPVRQPELKKKETISLGQILQPTGEAKANDLKKSVQTYSVSASSKDTMSAITQFNPFLGTSAAVKSPALSAVSGAGMVSTGDSKPPSATDFDSTNLYMSLIQRIQQRKNSPNGVTPEDLSNYQSGIQQQLAQNGFLQRFLIQNGYNPGGSTTAQPGKPPASTVIGAETPGLRPSAMAPSTPTAPGTGRPSQDPIHALFSPNGIPFRNFVRDAEKLLDQILSTDQALAKLEKELQNQNGPISREQLNYYNLLLQRAGSKKQIEVPANQNGPYSGPIPLGLILDQVQVLRHENMQRRQEHKEAQDALAQIQQYNAAGVLLDNYKAVASQDGDNSGLSIADIALAASRDGNSNNLSAEDLRKARETDPLRERVSQVTFESVRREADADGDGHLSPQELEAYKLRLEEEIRRESEKPEGERDINKILLLSEKLKQANQIRSDYKTYTKAYDIEYYRKFFDSEDSEYRKKQEFLTEEAAQEYREVSAIIDEYINQPQEREVQQTFRLTATDVTYESDCLRDEISRIDYLDSLYGPTEQRSALRASLEQKLKSAQKITQLFIESAKNMESASLESESSPDSTIKADLRRADSQKIDLFSQKLTETTISKKLSERTPETQGLRYGDLT